MLIALIVVGWIALILLVLLFLGGGKRAELEGTVYQQEGIIKAKDKTILFQEKKLDEAERTVAHKATIIKRRDTTLRNTKKQLQTVSQEARGYHGDLDKLQKNHEQAIQLFSEHCCKDHRYGMGDMFYLVNDPTETPHKVVGITVTPKEGTFYSFQDGKTKRTIHQRSMRKIEPKETEYPLDKPAHKKEGE
jgi:hypothetical protein